MSRSNRTRRSAKDIIIESTNDILSRPTSVENDAKLDLIQTIASKMGWVDLFNKINFRHRAKIQKAHWYQD